ncbi:MAG: low molecular weight phosphotyrosine protein phosphatase [Ignavibacteriaceae bacterium]|nr:low molecular weight phosphotyrosine protein phosphatase [Ignavibacteriaceae bacterium]
MIQKKILFVCLGNICRSPAAEGILKKILKEKGLNRSVEVDSAGTIAYHSGELPDSRMIKHAAKRGYILDHIARKFNPSIDFNSFDLIIPMDNQNYEDVIASYKSGNPKSKVIKMTDFSSNKIYDEVPDPYDSDQRGFELVLDILEDACKNLADKIEDEIIRINKKEN